MIEVFLVHYYGLFSTVQHLTFLNYFVSVQCDEVSKTGKTTRPVEFQVLYVAVPAFEYVAVPAFEYVAVPAFEYIDVLDFE
jgi:hypothetical protein